MVKVMLEWFLAIFIGVMIITQIIIPMFTDIGFFWLFRKKKLTEVPFDSKPKEEPKVQSTVQEPAVEPAKPPADTPNEDN